MSKMSQKVDGNLSLMQYNFCKEYLVDRSPGAAARRAGYSDASADVTGSRLLRVPKIKKQIDELSRNLADKVGVTAERVLKEYVKIAFCDISDVMDMKTGTVKDDADGSLIASLTVKDTDVGTTRTVKLHNKEKALEVLARFTGLHTADDDGKVTPEELKSFMRVVSKLDGGE